ncbi:GNAT family N-acetyltransferase [Amycolatopsis sp. NPDC051071]|uniref:GNAT family N-acetyltransferase n=1 Tax=Amycolatopsis sp. NPDC051071 TaxID=3154637 RepID=UPI0034160AFB
MKFGIYPGGRAGTVCSHPPDPAAIRDLVDDLAGGRPFVVREYVHFFGDKTPPDVAASLGAENALDHLTMPDEWYVEGGRDLDLVVSYISQVADLPGWLAFLDAVIDRYGHLTRYLQVTLEPNFPIPLIDGSAPGVLEALTLGIPHARSTVDRRGHQDVRIGFSVAEPPEWLGGDDDFWQYLSAIPPRDFAAHVDYVGLGLYPDAFSPVAPRGTPGDVASLTRHALHHLRNHSLPRAHLSSGTPIHIVENGTPSGAPRSEQAQSDSLSDMLGTILACRESLNITHYELFSLRDADSASDQPTGTLGITTDTYRPKAALAFYRDLVRGTGRLPEPRQARVSDHSAIVERVRQWWGDSRTPEEARELSLLLPKLFLQFFAGTSLVLEDEAGIRAFLVGFHAADNDTEAYIHFVGVDPELRGQGAARRLYTTFFQCAAETGRTEVRAITSPGNTGSIAFHRAMGFALETGDRVVDGLPVHSDYDGSGHDRVCFHRKIIR